MSAETWNFGPAVRDGGRRGRLLVAISVVFALGLAQAALMWPASAANPSANLDQCANDPAPSPSATGCDTSASQWVNGNIGASKAVYFEGDSIPYRMLFNNLSAGTHTVTIEWDTTKSGKHAIDYLTSFDRTVATANPCLGVSGCSPATFTSFAIPADPQVTGAGVTPVGGSFKLFGGLITGTSSYSYPDGSGFAGDKSARITINFTTTAARPNPVLAWGGHISTRTDWGLNGSAVTISGSPYHMRLIDLDGSGGNQDRSLSAEAVVFRASITIIKDSIPDDPQNFDFSTTGGLSPATFTLDDDGDPTFSNTQPYSGITNFTTYSVTEAAVAHWTLSFGSPVCTVTSANGGTQTGNAGTRTVTINLKEGENVSCTFTNTHGVNHPTIATELAVNPISVGESTHDTATLSGATSDAGGTVDYRFYGTQAGCDTDATAFDGTLGSLTGGTDVGTVSVTNGNVPDSANHQFDSAGNFFWAAFYTGDANNTFAASDCSTELLVVNARTPGIATTLSDNPIAVGTTIHDSAVLTGNPTATAGGSVDYRYYGTQAECTTDATAFDGTFATLTGGTDVGSVTVTNALVPDSADATFNDAGTFYWAAFYTGDANNVFASSPCDSEVLTVNPLSPTIATTLSANPIAVGTTIHDSSALTGATATAGGSVDYRYYGTQAECTIDATAFDGTLLSLTGGTDVGSVTVTNALVPDSADATFNDAGTFYWAAFYTGDANNVFASSPCDSEVLTVNPLSPTIATLLATTPISVGESTHDTATLSGATSDAGGTVDYRFYGTQAGCDTDATAFDGTLGSLTGGTDVGTVSVTNGNVPDSANHQFDSAGNFFWAAFYTGDANNTFAASDCSTELLVVNARTPGIATTLSDNPIAVGTTIHDSAVLTGNPTATAGGSVDYRYYGTQAECTTDATAFDGTFATLTGGTDVGSVTVTNALVPDSADATFNDAGTFYWAAFYTGDANNVFASSPCDSEVLTVNPLSPTIATTLSANPIAVGTTIHDSSALTGATATAGGSVDYRYYGTQAECTTDATAFDGTFATLTGGTDVGSVTVTNALVPDSADATFNDAGTFYWAAFYTGDANNVFASSPCDSEVLTVNPLSPTIATTLSANPIAVGTTIHDSSALTGATATAGGSVDYRYYGTQAECTIDATAFDGTLLSLTGGTDVGSVTVTNALVPDSADATFNDAGTFYWAAFYTGDANNVFASSPCDSEVLTVNPLSPTIATLLATTPISVGESTHDTATLSGATSDAGGTVDYRFYGTQAGCDTDATAFDGTLGSLTGGTDVGTVSVTNGNVPDSANHQFDSAGNFFWAAFYTGDANNTFAASDCSTELLVVNARTPGIATTLSDNPIAVGTTIHDSAVLTGNPTATAGGSVDYRYYGTQAECTTDATAFDGTFATLTGGTDVGSVTVTNALVPDSADATFNDAGTFYWAAFYTGDANNVFASSPCDSEVLTVNPLSPTIATTLSANPIAVGTTIHDSSALTGATATAGGSVDYRYYGTQAECTTDATAFDGTFATLTGGTDVGSVTVTNALVPDSADATFNDAGTFYWAAFYTGDANNVFASSPCDSEVLTVNPLSPTIATTLSANPIAVGTTIHDSSALTGATATAGGSVDYRYYGTQAECTIDATAFDGTLLSLTGGTDVGSVTVTNALVPDSADATFNDAGTFYWAAFYTGDANNVFASSPCDSEVLTVNPLSPTIATLLATTPISVGESTHDTATLSGATSDAGGTVDYRFYGTQAGCDTDATAFDGTLGSLTGGTDVGTVSVTNGNVPDSANHQFDSAGNFFWAAFYTGDANNTFAASDCSTELLVVNARTPGIATTLSDNPIAVGTTIHDSAVLTGNPTATAGGSVDYRYYGTQAECTTDATAFDGTFATLTGGTDVGSVTVTNALVPDSADATFNDAGTFYWAAFYTGDANNVFASSPCDSEVLTVNPLSPTIATTLSANPIAVGTTIHDSSALTGATATAGGSVDYRYYGTQAECTTDATAFDGTFATLTGGTDVGSVTVTNALVPDSADATFNDAGTFYWAAFYTGDANNVFASSPCDSEVLTVNPLSPTIATTLSANPIAVGTTIHDSSALTGATATAGGSVDYRYYGTQAECTIDATAFDGTLLSLTGGTDVGSVTVTNALVPDSADATFNDAGTFYWAAFYTGDANNVFASSPCDSEVLTVNPLSPTIATLLATTPISVGESTHDTATLSGATSDAGGTVDYRFYGTQAGCDTDATAFDGTLGSLTGGTDVGTVSVTNGNVPDSANHQFDSAGNFFWAAFYTGDANNTFASSDCSSELLVVNAPPNVGQITPTATTCTEFSSGIAETLDTVNYSVKSGIVSQVNPGVFFYWIKVSAVTGSNTVTIGQSITSANNNFTHFFATTAGSRVFNPNCTALQPPAAITTTAGVTTITFNVSTGGTYIVGIKYDAGSVKGFTAPSSNTTVDYNFAATLNGGAIPGSDQPLHLVTKT